MVARDYILTRQERIGAIEIDGIKYPQFVIRGNPGEYKSHGTEDFINAPTADNVYALIGIRAKSSFPDLRVSVQLASVIVDTNDKFEWRIYQDPVVAGTFEFTDKANSGVQVATGATANTVTGGEILPRGYGEGNAAIQAQLEREFELGESGSTIVLAAKSFSQQANFQGSFGWIELL